MIYRSSMSILQPAYLALAGLFFAFLAYYFSNIKRRMSFPVLAVLIVIFSTLTSVMLLFFGLGVVWWPNLLFTVGSWLNAIGI